MSYGDLCRCRKILAARLLPEIIPIISEYMGCEEREIQRRIFYFQKNRPFKFRDGQSGYLVVYLKVSGCFVLHRSTIISEIKAFLIDVFHDYDCYSDTIAISHLKNKKEVRSISKYMKDLKAHAWGNDYLCDHGRPPHNSIGKLWWVRDLLYDIKMMVPLLIFAFIYYIIAVVGIYLLETDPVGKLLGAHDEIDWSGPASNPAAIDLLNHNLDKIDWFYLSKNTSIFPLVPKIDIENML